MNEIEPIKFTSGTCWWCKKPVDIYSRSDNMGRQFNIDNKPYFEHSRCRELNISNHKDTDVQAPA